MNFDKNKFEALIKKSEELRQSGTFDLSKEEDLSLAVMNLISIEEHLFFTASKTKDKEYLSILNETRELRKELLAKMIPVNEGETWCISKHFLAASMRMIEVGTKLQSAGEKKDAEEMFEKAYKIYSMFWAIRLKLADVSDIKDEDVSKNDNKEWTTEDIMEKLIDCCKE